MTCRHALCATTLAAALAGIVGCGGIEIEETGGERETFYRRPYPDGKYVMTTFGGPGDAQNTTCGVWADGSTYYSTGVYGWGCNAKVRVTANGKCAILRVIDNGPAAWVESKAGSRCGVGRVLDVSPAASRHLFGVSGAGWSDCRMINVEKVSSSLPAGPCSSSSSGGGSWTPPSIELEGESCQVGSLSGVCKNTQTSSCASGFKSGYCPGPSNIKCCLDGDGSSSGTTSAAGAGDSCTVGSQTGTCLDTSAATCATGFRSGYCPGASNIKCCPAPAPCEVGATTGECLDTNSATCASGFESGYCPGASNIRCCLD